MSMEQLQAIEEAQEFFNKNNKVRQQLLEWEMNNLKRMQAQFQEANDEELEIAAEEIHMLIHGAYASNPRFLFDFLDEKGVIVVINYHDGLFFYSVNGGDSVGYDTRLGAEKAAFKEAIETLEGKLS